MNSSKPPAAATVVALRPEFQQPPQAAWIKLCSSLVTISLKTKKLKNSDERPSDLAIAEAALGEIVGYVMPVVGLSQEGAILPLLRLMEAIRDLQMGGRPDMLKPLGGKPKTSIRRAAMIGFAARCADELLKAGKGETEDGAAKKVVAALRKGEAIDCKRTSAETIKNWRNLCNARSGGRKAAISELAYAQFNNPNIESLGDTPASRAAAILKILSEAKKRALD